MLPKIALALDLDSQDKMAILIDSLEPKPQILKVGLEAVCSLGIERCFDIVNEHSPGSKIFLDLKLHDIPNTVAKTICSLNRFRNRGLSFLTVHGLGGSDMLRAAYEASAGINIVTVTLLTSHSEVSLRSDFSLPETLDMQQLSFRLVRNSFDLGLRWFVCSVHECRTLKKQFPSVSLITPGIRSLNTAYGDQSRVASPLEAIEQGSDLLVVGRQVTSAENPPEAWKELLHSFETGSS